MIKKDEWKRVLNLSRHPSHYTCLVSPAISLISIRSLCKYPVAYPPSLNWAHHIGVGIGKKKSLWVLVDYPRNKKEKKVVTRLKKRKRWIIWNGRKQHPFFPYPPPQRTSPLKNNSTQKGKYNLYVQPINLIQKRGLGQTRSECEETGKGSARKWRGSKEEVGGSPCKLPLSSAPPGEEGVSPPCPPLFCSGPKGKAVPWLGPQLTHLNLVHIQAFRSRGRSPLRTWASSWRLPQYLAHCVFSHPFYVTWVPRTDWGAPLWLEGVSPNH